MDKDLYFSFAKLCKVLGVKDLENEKIYNRIGQINKFEKDKVIEFYSTV